MGADSKLNSRFWLLAAFVTACAVATVLCVIFLPYIVVKEIKCHELDPQNEQLLRLKGQSGAELVINLNTKGNVKRIGKYYNCRNTTRGLRRSHRDKANCRRYEWRLQNSAVPAVTDCVELGQQKWYGGSILWNQKWPLNGVEQPEAPYVPGDVYQQQYGGVMERFWISSGGFSIFVEESVPLIVEMRKDQLCLTGSLRDSRHYDLSARSDNESLLAYTICNAGSARVLHKSLQLWQFPSELPARELFSKPIWSTWAYLKQNISTQSVLSFAQNISRQGLMCSQIEIDDKWSTNYGDHEFDLSRFPDPLNLTRSIHSLGYNVTIWLHPFANSDSRAFAEGREAMAKGEGYFVAARDNASEPARTSWWRGQEAALIDVTNASSLGAQQLRRQLQQLQRLGVDSFKFDGGEANWIQQGATFAVSRVNPGWYTNSWSQFSYEADTELRRQETRIGFRAQQLPILVRTMDKDSHWGVDNGLKAVVTSALTHCLIGYNFFLPDMIGGNAYCNITGLEGRCYPDKELYIRWLQVAVFMPSLQFSVPPWIYDSGVVQLTRELLRVRSEPRFQQNLDKALEDALNNVPIVRPIWWLQNDRFDIQDQFLLGDRILVAPVMDEGARSRSVYFPKGKWRPWYAANSSDDIDGPSTIKQYDAALNQVPAFYLIQS